MSSKIDVFDGIELIGLSIYFPKQKTLVLSDIHIGYEESLNRQGILLPRVFFKHLYDKTKNLIQELDVKTIVLNGDLKHEFDEISRTEWRHTIKFLDIFKDKKIVLIKGNHDNILGPIASERNLELKDYYIIDSMIIIHGDRVFDFNQIEKETNSKIKTIIIGHEHPAVTLVADSRSETFKCFLIGKYKNRNLVVMPSYNEITNGTNVLEQNILSPYLDQNLDSFKVIVYGKELFDFGKVGQLRKIKKLNKNN